MTTLKIDDGYVAFPRRTSLAIAVSFAVGIVGQTAAISWGASKLDSRVAALEASDTRMSDRSNERYGIVVERLERLERDRDRLARLEEQMKGLGDLLREIRQDIRRR